MNEAIAQDARIETAFFGMSKPVLQEMGIKGTEEEKVSIALKNFFIEQGIVFGAQDEVKYIKAVERLVVKTTAFNVRKIERIMRP